MSSGRLAYVHRRFGWIVVAAAALIIGMGGYAALQWRTHLATEQVRNRLVEQAFDLARAINPERVRALTFTPEDAGRPEFQRLCSQMTAYRSAVGARAVWGVAPRDGRFWFGPAAYAQGDSRSVSPGMRFEQPPHIDRILTEDHAFAALPRMDHRGDRFAAIAPVRDPRSGQLLMIVGLELAADQWRAALFQTRRDSILSVLVLIILLFLGAGAVAWRSRLTPDRAARWRSTEVYTLAAVGLTLTLMAAWAFDDSQRRFSHRQFRQLALASFDLVLRAFRDLQVNKLGSLELFFQSSQEVNRDEFQRFTAAMARQKGIQSIAWIPPVPDERRAEWEARARAEGLMDFAIWQPDARGGRQPAAGRSIYFPVWFVEPYLENAMALGFDQGSEAARREALETARESGLPTVSAPVCPIGLAADTKGLSVFQPFYMGEGAMRELTGFGLAAVQVKAFLQTALSSPMADTTATVVELYQNLPGQPPLFISDSWTEAGFTSTGKPGIWHSSDPKHGFLCQSFPLFAFGQAYTLFVHPSPEFLASLPARAWGIALAVGLVLTAVLTALAHVLLRRRAVLETQVQTRTAELKATLYSIGDAVVTADIHGRIRQMNPVAVEFTGWPEAEAQGQPLEQVLRIGGDRDDPEPNLLASVLAGKGAEGLNGHDAWLVDRHGGRRPIDYSGAAIRSEQGDFGGMVLVLRDSSERKQAEAALYQQNDLLWRITDTSPVGIVVTDANGRITFVNGTAETITGLSREQLFRRGHQDIPWRLFDADGGPLTQADFPFRKILTAQGPISDVQYALDRPDGRRVLLSVNGAPLRDAAGKISGAVFSLSDITAQKQLQESFLQAQKMESVGRLAGGVAHDFNNMLSVINGYSEMLLGRLAADDPIRGEVQEILGAGRRSELLVRQLLAFARKQAIAPVRLDLNKTVTATLKMLSRMIGEDIKLVWAPSRDIWPVRMDPAQLDQILSNLVVNARDAITGVGKVTIETSTASFDPAYCETHPNMQPGHYVLLAVSDNGSGMDRNTLAHLFEPFFTTKAQGQGTGLGLATVYGIVRQNNGFIDVSSEPGQGTTFKIYLPRLDEAPAINTSSAGPVRMATGTETVLLVEDEEALLKLSELLLKKLGYTVLAAGTPEQAIHLVQAHTGTIHLLMTDVVMPEMSGRDLWQRISAMRPELKCLYMSGYTANVITHHGVLDPGVHFLQKPFQLRDLAAKLREALAS
jgi:PAS domain S-box-containing protein